MKDLIESRIKETIRNLNTVCLDDALMRGVSESAESIVASLRSGNKLMICGNGGSAADAQHVAGEFVCRFYKDREPLPGIALSTDSSILTAVANDYSYNSVFSRQVRAIGKAGDVLMGISTSGSSGNVLEAFMVAREKGIKTILLTGSVKKQIAEHSDIVITVPSDDTPRIQEMHLVIEHIICEIVERELCGAR